MSKILHSVLVLSLGLSPTLLALLTPQIAQAQATNFPSQELKSLLDQARRQTQSGQPKQAIATLEQALQIARQQQNRLAEATALLGIGFNLNKVGQAQSALAYFNQALPILQAVGDRAGEATTLNNIGGGYRDIGQPQKALDYFNQSLPIWQAVSNRAGEATTLNAIGLVYRDIGQPQKALNYYTQALPIWQAVGDRVGQAIALNNIGSVYRDIGQPQKALGYYTQALPILQTVGDQAGQAIALNNIGAVYSAIGQPQKALDYYTQSLPILQAVGYRAGQATTLNNIGGVYSAIGQPQKALDYYTQSLPIWQAVGDRVGQSTTLNNIGAVYSAIGQPQKALDYYTQALPIRQAVGDRAGEATTLNNIGAVYSAIGQPQKALEYYTQALPIHQAVGDRAGEATTLNDIGLVYSAIGQPQKALDYYTQALPIRQAVGDRVGQARTLNNIGLVYTNIGQLKKALDYLTQALPIWQALSDKAGQATTLNNIGLVYTGIGQPQKALDYFTQALPIRLVVGDKAGQAVTLHNIGGVYSTIGQPQKALDYYTQALPILQAVGDRAVEITTLSNIGAVYQATNRPTQAITNLEQSIKLTLQTRSGLLRQQRKAFVRAEVGPDIALVSLLIERQEPERAYQWVNLTATAELADYTRLLNAKVANPEAQKALDEWNQKNQQLQLLRQRLGETDSDDLARQVRTLEAEDNREAEILARRFPETAELFETTPADIAQLQANIPVGTTVIHPVLLTDIRNVSNTIAFFILTRNQLQVVKASIDPKTFNALLTTTAQQLNNRFDNQYLENLSKLYDLLIRPIEVQIQATNPKQLSIIATGKLRYLPFESLYNSKTDQYLLQKYPVSYLTRLSPRSLAVKPSATTPKQILALGNPVPTAPLELPSAETEVKAITQILPGSTTLIGKQATLDAFKVQALRFPFLHLATHGCFETQGCCLSKSPNCHKPDRVDLQPNTILFADQSFNIADAALLGLQNVDLITLSACQTALETSSNGEEIAGLAYLFERAGAKATIASLWNAPDEKTQTLMVQFYTNLKQGMSKSEALQKAKLSQITSHPFFWAPFVLIGDPR